MRVLLTGATGFVGRVLGRRLIAEGHRLVVLTRSPERAKGRLPFECELHAWDPLKAPAPAEAFDGGVDAIIHLAGEPVAGGRWDDSRKALIRDSRVIGTRHLVQTINQVFDEGEGRPGALLMASGIGYYGDRGDEVLTEGSSAGAGFLAEVCEAWEAEAASLDGPRLAVLRLGMVLGSGGGALQKMLPAFRRGLGGKLGSGRQWVSWIHVEDVAGLFAHLLKAQTVEGTLNAVSPIPVTNAEFTRALGRALGRATLLSVPAMALRLCLGQMADELLLTSNRVLPVKARACGYHFRYERLSDALAASVSEPAQKTSLPSAKTAL